MSALDSAPPKVGRGATGHAGQWSHSVLPYIFIAPLLLALLIFTYLPIAVGIRLSVTNATFGSSSSEYVGLENYRALLADSRFWQIFYQTIIWTALSVAGGVACGVAAALALQRSDRRSALMRGVLLLPWAAPPIVIVYTWRAIINPTGPVSPRLQEWGLADSAPDILNSTWSMLGISGPLIAVTLLGIWSAAPFVAVFTLGALSALPQEILEAAKMDGASPFKTFTKVVWPLIRPVVETTAVLLALTRFGGLDLPFLLTAGGPGDASSVFGVLIYNTAFGSLRAGVAAAIGVLVFLLMLPLSILYVRRAVKSATG